jgi:hypothetical protein
MASQYEDLVSTVKSLESMLDSTKKIIAKATRSESNLDSDKERIDFGGISLALSEKQNELIKLMERLNEDLPNKIVENNTFYLTKVFIKNFIKKTAEVYQNWDNLKNKSFEDFKPKVQITIYILLDILSAHFLHDLDEDFYDAVFSSFVSYNLPYHIYNSKFFQWLLENEKKSFEFKFNTGIDMWTNFIRKNDNDFRYTRDYEKFIEDCRNGNIFARIKARAKYRT